MADDQASVAQIREWLDAVPDPEIPVISIVDLGIVRDVQWRDDVLDVVITPTYSGCPAMSVIPEDIKTELGRHGINKINISTQIAPVWTTDWLSDKGRANLKGYGIAAPRTTGVPEGCPRCESVDVEKISQFGSTPCKAQWRCKSCLEPFDYFKCI